MLHVGRQEHFLGRRKRLVVRVLRELEPLEREAVIDGHYLGKKRQGSIPVFQYFLGPVASGVFIVTFHQAAEERLVLYGRDTLDIRHVQIAAGIEKPRLVVHEGHAAAHARGKIVAGFAEHDHDAAGHVFAAVIAEAFDHRDRAAVPYREPLSRDAVQENLAAGRAVKDGIPGNDIFMGNEPGADRRNNHDTPAGHALAEVIVGVPFQPKENSRREKRSHALARAPLEPDFDGAVRQPFFAVPAGHLAADMGSHRAVHIPDGRGIHHPPSAFEGGSRRFEHRRFEGGFIQSPGRIARAAGVAAGSHTSLIEERAQVEFAAL